MSELQTSMLERVPPQNLEAEMAALGAMLLEREAIGAAMEFVRPEDFYRESHRLICQGIFELNQRNEPVDLITLGEWLKARDLLERVGGTHYLTAVMAQTPTAAGIAYYCEIVRDKARRRELIRMADRLMAEAYTAEEGAEIIPRYQRELDLIEVGARDLDSQQLWEWEEAAILEMRAADELGHEVGIRSNLASLNQVLDPMVAGDMIVIAGRPSMGKSVLAVQLALGACQRGARALFVSLEMGSKALASRAMIAESGVPAWKAKMLNYRRAHGEEVYDPFEMAVERHRDYDLEIVRPKQLTPYDVMVLGRRKRHGGGLELIVVDYLQLMGSNDGARDTYERVSAISRELKEVAVTLAVPVVVISQLSRECEKRSPKRPMLSDLRESGAIEQDADAVVFLYRPGYYDGDNFAENRRLGLEPGDKHSTELIVAKQRNGQTGSAWTYFDLERSRFFDLADKEGNGDG